MLIQNTTVPLTERWIPVAFRMGKVRFLYPVWFPSICGSQHEVEDRVRIRLSTDPTFKAQFLGWSFLAAPLNSIIINHEDGRVASAGDTISR